MESLENSASNNLHKSSSDSSCSGIIPLNTISPGCSEDQVQILRWNEKLVVPNTSKHSEDLTTKLSKTTTSSFLNPECSSEYSNMDRENVSERSVGKKTRVTDEVGSDGLWRVRTYTGYIVTLDIHLNRDKPQQFPSKSAEVMWHAANEINMIRLKHQIQSGEYFPEDAIIEVDPFPLKMSPVKSGNLVLEPKEKRIEKIEAYDSFKMTVLTKEISVVEAALSLQECFSHEPQVERGLEVLDSFLHLELSNLILKKNPFVVYTIQNLCYYEPPVILESVQDVKEKIQEKAKAVYSKIQSMFSTVSGISFEENFREQCTLLWKICGFSTKRIHDLVHDPTLQIL